MSMAPLYAARVVRDKISRMERFSSFWVGLLLIEVAVVWQEPPVAGEAACRARCVSEHHANGPLDSPDDFVELLACLLPGQDPISEPGIPVDACQGVGIGSSRESHDVATPEFYT